MLDDVKDFWNITLTPFTSKLLTSMRWPSENTKLVMLTATEIESTCSRYLPVHPGGLYSVKPVAETVPDRGKTSKLLSRTCAPKKATSKCSMQSLRKLPPRNPVSKKKRLTKQMHDIAARPRYASFGEHIR